MLLRGASLKNTDYIFGVVCFTGHDTKIMKNSSSARTKRSKIERMTNSQIIAVFIMQVGCCLFGAVFGTFWLSYNLEQVDDYLQVAAEGTPSGADWVFDALKRFGTWILIFTNTVPISLMVTLEVVKFIQAIFISWDWRIYDVKKDMPTKV